MESAAQTIKDQAAIEPVLKELSHRTDWYREIEDQQRGESGPAPPQNLVAELKTLRRGLMPVDHDPFAGAR
jgi:hypothetical protein